MLVAGPTPFIASALVAAAGGSPWLVAVYLIGCQVLTIVGVTFARGATGPTQAESLGVSPQTKEPRPPSAE